MTWCNANGKYGEQLKEEFVGLDENNQPITLGDISRGSKRRVWWRCSKCNNEWPTAVCRRTNEKFRRGCPECGKKIISKASRLKGESLANWCDANGKYGIKIRKEFTGKTKSGDIIKIQDISKGSNISIKWKCSKCGNEWYSRVADRTDNDRSGCPHCNACGTSFPEQFIFNSLLQLFPNTKNRQKDKILNYEHDIVIPEINLCIEYSGYSWHADKLERDQAKANHCKENGVQFLQIYAHNGEITDEQGSPIEDIYGKNQILYKISRYKTQHIPKLQYIIKFILEQYAPNHSIKEVNFELAEQQANKVMGKA